MDKPLEHVHHRYAHGEHRPLSGYVATGVTYAVAAGGLLVAGKRKGAAAQTRISAGDLVLLTIATHRLARTLAKDAVTSPLRAPVTRYQATGMPSEVNEEVVPEVKDQPLLHTLGELITCPFCLGQWVATGLVGGHVLAPTLTRVVTSTLTAVAGADALQFAYSALQRLEGSDRG
ncbi:MAG TPA: DUF1360 domain-containing protein [Segeticoccus sp.]|nr:DUF1360 domain-containing protein [Segeticoccus sp.]